MKKIIKEHWALVLIAALTTIFLIAVCIPHMVMGQYNFPSGDDYSFTTNTHRVMQTGSFLDTIKCIFWDNPIDWSKKWEGRWAISLLIGMSPSIWGIRFYKTCVFIAFFFIIASHLYFFKNVFGNKKVSGLLAIVTAEMTLIMEIFFVTFPGATFFWWTGIAAYTIPFCLYLFVMGKIIRILSSSEEETTQRFWPGFMLISFLLGGGNYSVSILMFTSLLFLGTARLIYYRKKKVEKHIKYRDFSLFLSVILSLLAGLSLVFLSPALQIQLQSRYGGSARYSLFVAIYKSVELTLQRLVAFFDWKNCIFLLLLIPFAVMMTRQMEYKFSHPWFVSIVSILLLASQISVNMMIDGTIGNIYSIDIWFYAFYLAVVCNEIYWIGWLCRRRIGNLFEHIPNQKFQLGVFLYTSIFIMMLVFSVCAKDLSRVSSYQAYLSLQNGSCQQYAAQWEERIDILENEYITEVEFEPMQVHGGYIQIYDLYPRGDGAYWVNCDTATYFGKEYIDIVLH